MIPQENEKIIWEKRNLHPKITKNRGERLNLLEKENFYKTQCGGCASFIHIFCLFFDKFSSFPRIHSFIHLGNAWWWHDCEILLCMLCNVSVVMKRDTGEWAVDRKNRNHGWISNINANHNQIYYWQCRAVEFPTNKLSHSFMGGLYFAFISLMNAHQHLG